MALPPTSAIVGLTSTEIVSANDHRTGLLIRNLSVNTVVLAFGCTAELGKGCILKPNEVFSMSKYDFSTSCIKAISDSAGSNVSIQEFDE